MSAVSAYWPDTGRLECMAAFPEIPDLAERGVKDNVGDLYGRMARRGELLTLGERVVDIRQLLGAALERFGAPAVVVADRWREAELRQELGNGQIPRCELVTRGMGFRDGAADVREFRRSVVDRKVATPVSLLVRSALSEAVTVSDPAGNSKLAKHSEGGRRQGHRDDAAAAVILAVAEGSRRIKSVPTDHKRRRRTAVVR